MISEIEAANTMYSLFHVKNCFNKIILLLLLLLLENSINRYLILKNNYTEFIYIPINLYSHNMWATRRLEMGENEGFGGGVEVAGGCGWGRGWYIAFN